MSTDIVFKFVTLRTPANDSIDNEIIPEEAYAALFEEFLDQTAGDLPYPDQLEQAANKFVDSDIYLLNQIAWKNLFGSPQRLYALISDPALNVEQFRDLADQMLQEIMSTENNRVDEWGDEYLNKQIWGSYISSIFSSGERGYDTAFFLNLLRLIFAYEQSFQPDFELSQLNLIKRRAILPASITLGLLNRLEGGSQGESVDQGNDSEIMISSLIAEVSDLTSVLQKFDNAKRRKRRRLIEHTNTMLQERAEIQTERNEQSEDRINFVVPSIISQEASPNSSLKYITFDDLEDEEAVLILKKHKLDPDLGFTAMKDALKSIIAFKKAEIRRLQTVENLVWEDGAFIRVRKKIVRRQEAKNTLAPVTKKIEV